MRVLEVKNYMVIAAAAALVVGAVGGRANAAVLTNAVNVDFNRDSNSMTYSGTAADAADAGTVWNGVIAGTTATNLVDSFGVNSGVSVSATGSNNYSDNTTGNPTPLALMSDYRFIQNGTITLTLSNVPDNTYKLYVYAAGNAGSSPYQGANITLATVNLVTGGVGTAATTGANRNIYDAGNPATTGVNSAGTNYVILDAITSDPTNTGFGTITVTLANQSANGQQYAALNGLQLQAIPEPASLAAVGLLTVGLLSRRRQAR